jgi:hypothetical protein
MEKIIVDVKVQKFIKEFILSTNGSDLIVPESKSLLWQLLKQHLKVTPAAWTSLHDRSEYIRIEILNTHSAKILAHKMKGHRKGQLQEITINTGYRFYLDERGQAAVAKQFRKAFKECFHNFVFGSIFDNPMLQQKQAIENFCSAYRIAIDDMNYEMLVKSWMRSPQKAILKGQKSYSPLIF